MKPSSAEYCPGQDRRTIIYAFTGLFQPESLVAFMHHRAQRLGIVATVIGSSTTRISVEVTGQIDLLGAFEMACSLGPADGLVRDVSIGAGILDTEEQEVER